MIGPKYGTLPIARNTGGIHDTVEPLDPESHRGNGFLFDHYSAEGFRWAIDQALAFFQRPTPDRVTELRRIMIHAIHEFCENTMAERYFHLYEQILERPLTKSPDEPTQLLTSPLPLPPALRTSCPPESISVAV